jgi:hypothetical protein
MLGRRSNYRGWLIAMLVWTGFASQVEAFSGGTGEPNSPYQVSMSEHLLSIGADPNLLEKHFVLVNDIDLDPNFPGGQMFARAVIAADTNDRFGWQGVPFEGSFSGRGHTIRNLTLRAKSGSNSYLGLFGAVGRNAVVEDLRIEAANVEGDGQSVGILAGENAGRILNCYVEGRLSGGDVVIAPTDAGGFVGRNRGDIVNCQANTRLVWGYENIGGLVGCNELQGRIVGCCAACAHVYAHKYQAGGLVGRNEGYIIGSHATGEVRGWDHISHYGGLVGGDSGTIINSHADSDVVSSSSCVWLGGLVGWAGGTIINCYATGSIRTGERCNSIGGLTGVNSGKVVNSYAIGKISTGANTERVGGLVGTNAGGDVRMSFWDIEASGITESAGGTGVSTVLRALRTACP